MAHLQSCGKRISPGTQLITIQKSMELELWGPYKPDKPDKPDSQPYLLVSSDATAISVTLSGAYQPASNVQSYNLKAISLSARVKLEVVDGELM